MGVAIINHMGSTGANYRAASAAARDAGHGYQPGSPDHGHYSTGWDHAVHKGKRGDRKHPAHARGVVHGLMWKRRNPEHANGA